MSLSRHDIENRFMFHPAAGDREREAAHEAARAEMKRTAHAVNRLLPDCCERDRAIDRLDEALMWANAAIARKR